MADLGFSHSCFSCKNYKELAQAGITKVVGLFTSNPTKLSLHFSDFCMIFYGIYKNQQNTCTIWDGVLHRGPWKVFQIHTHAPGSRKTPWKERGRCNWALGHGGRRFRPKSGELAARVAGERAGKRLGTHQGLIWVLGWGRRGCRWGGPRLSTAAATGALAPAGLRPRKSNGRRG
jgi:hypothetical protein